MATPRGRDRVANKEEGTRKPEGDDRTPAAGGGVPTREESGRSLGIRSQAKAICSPATRGEGMSHGDDE